MYTNCLTGYTNVLFSLSYLPPSRVPDKKMDCLFTTLCYFYTQISALCISSCSAVYWHACALRFTSNVFILSLFQHVRCAQVFAKAFSVVK